MRHGEMENRNSYKPSVAILGLVGGWASFPNSVWERPLGKLCFPSRPRTRNRSFQQVRSQTEFGNETRSEKREKLTPTMLVRSAADTARREAKRQWLLTVLTEIWSASAVSLIEALS